MDLRENIGVILAATLAICGCGDEKKRGAPDKEAFETYAAKSKGTEALMNLKKLADGARMYYMDPPSAGLTPTAPQFPNTTIGPTPPLGACCKGERKQCAPVASNWEDKTWKALQFGLHRPHYFSYQYETKDNGKSFTVRAHADLDCDGEYSTFELKGTSTPDGPRISPGLTRMKELE